RRRSRRRCRGTRAEALPREARASAWAGGRHARASIPAAGHSRSLAKALDRPVAVAVALVGPRRALVGSRELRGSLPLTSSDMNNPILEEQVMYTRKNIRFRKAG